MEFNNSNYILDRTQIVFHNRSSTDYGLKLLMSFTPPAPQPDKTPTQVPGVSGDFASNAHSYRASDLVLNFVARIPPRYSGDWLTYKSDVENWLYGDKGYLRFGDDPAYLYEAEVYTVPTFTQVNSERQNVSVTFHIQPYKVETDSINWTKIPSSGIVYNPEPTNVKPDWHINGNGSFLLKVNDFPYEFDDVDGDLYLIGHEGNAYSKDPTIIQSGVEILNDHLRLANNEAPQFICAGDGSNTVTVETLSGTLNKIEFIPKWRRLV